MIIPWPWMLLGAALVAGVQTVRLEHEKAAFAQYKAKVATDHAAQVQRARDEERAITAAQKESTDVALKDAAAARADAASAASVADRLRQRATDLARRCTSAAAQPGSPPASSPGDVLADMQRRLEAAGRELARYGDESRIAGRACESAYDAVMTRD